MAEEINIIPDLVPSLKEAVALFNPEFDPWQYHVPVSNKGGRPAFAEPINQIPVFAGKDHVLWEAPKISQLFRGDTQPPDLGRDPALYDPYFQFIERHACAYFYNFTPPSDQNMESFYSNLARRPDGKISEPMHAHLWQTLALMLGIYPISAAQYEAILRRLVRSAATFSIKPISRNYATNIMRLFVPGA